MKVTPHLSLNSSKGVIRCPDLSGLSDEEILTELEPQEVSGVRMISFPKGDKRIPTNTLVITFSTPHLPKTIKVGYLIVKVQVYIPNPLRCFGCQRFGHHETKCRSDIHRCKKCGEDEHFHNESNCPNPPKCVNCNGPHEVTSKECPVWLKEKEILKVKYTQNLSFPEARKIVNEKFSKSSENQSYVSITKTNAHTSVVLVDSCTQLKEFDVQPSDKVIISKTLHWNQKTQKTDYYFHSYFALMMGVSSFFNELYSCSLTISAFDVCSILNVPRSKL